VTARVIVQYWAVFASRLAQDVAMSVTVLGDAHIKVMLGHTYVVLRSPSSATATAGNLMCEDQSILFPTFCSLKKASCNHRKGTRHGLLNTPAAPQRASASTWYARGGGMGNRAVCVPAATGGARRDTGRRARGLDY
jgi:hypothetical protein